MAPVLSDRSGLGSNRFGMADRSAQNPVAMRPLTTRAGMVRITCKPCWRNAHCAGNQAELTYTLEGGRMSGGEEFAGLVT
jgi:hypothetical protein